MAGSLKHHRLVDESRQPTNISQPTIQQTPPIGVIAPITGVLVKTSAYRLPEKKTNPATINARMVRSHPDHRMGATAKASKTIA
tara:strand:+ start:452 stop:703 length:252 start_codon:yes stop_codon:yes gene_type:complete